MKRLVIAAAIIMLGALPAAAQQDRFNCEDYETQAAAQRNLDRNPDDPNRLDANNNGQACEEFFEGTDGGGAAVPNRERPAQEDIAQPAPADRFDCADFTSQARPQRILERIPSDPHGLDANGDGVACDEFFPADTSGDVATDPTAVAAEEDVETGDAAAGRRAVDDRDCVEFAFQEDAQVVLDQDRSDPYNLDPSGDGVACSSLPYRVAVTRLPSTGTGAMAAILAAGRDDSRASDP